MVHRFVAPHTGRYFFELDGTETGFDSMLLLLASCPPPVPSHCLGVADGPGPGELVSTVLFAGEEVFLIVDGVNNGRPQSGVFRLQAEVVEGR